MPWNYQKTILKCCKGYQFLQWYGCICLIETTRACLLQLYSLGGVPLSFYIGQLSDFCVFGFAFLSGYAHMLQYGQKGYYKRRLKGLLSLCCSYWLIVVVFSVISIAAGQGSYMPGSFKKFVLNALMLENSYNGAWWYMSAYAVLVVISPLVLKWIKQGNPVVVFCAGFALYCMAYYVRFKLGSTNWLLSRFGYTGMTLFEYMLGALAFRYRAVSRIGRIWKRVPQTGRAAVSVALIVGMLYGHTKIVPSLFIAPVTGFVVMLLFHFWDKPQFVKKAFLTVGRHSTNIWLIHMFFYSVLFKNFVYVAKYPLLIFTLMLVITLVLSHVLQQIEKPIQMIISKI